MRVKQCVDQPIEKCKMWGYCVWSFRSPSIDVLLWTKHCDGSMSMHFKVHRSTWMHQSPTEVIAPALFFFGSDEMDRIFCFLSPMNGNYLFASVNKINQAMTHF